MQQRLVIHQWEQFSDKVRIDQSPFLVLFLVPGIRKEDRKGDSKRERGQEMGKGMRNRESGQGRGRGNIPSDPESDFGD